MTDRQLSNNFWLSEMTKSGVAERLLIDNTPSEEEIVCLERLCLVGVQPVRDNFGIGIVPSSGFRCEDLEKAICWGRRPNSSFGRWCQSRGLPIDASSWPAYFESKEHPKGWATDFEVPGVPNLEVAKFIKEAIHPFRQLILEYYDGTSSGGWIHLSVGPDGTNNQKVLTLVKGEGYMTGLPE